MPSPEYIRFEYIEDSPSGKTKILEVQNVRTGTLLGVIKWYGPWRQYTFWPEDNTVFNYDCLDKISRQLLALNVVKKKAVKK